MVSVDDLRGFLGIDYEDDMVDANIKTCLYSARAWACGAIGDSVFAKFEDDARLDRLLLVVASDFYNNRDYEGKYSGLRSRLITDIVMQLKMEVKSDGD
jgi:hypothetical protein